MPEHEIKSKIIDLAEIQENDSVLDFGFGTGTSLIILAQRHPSARLFGFEVDNEIVEIAMSKFKKKNVVVKIYLENLSIIPTESMDKIISSWVFHHLVNEDKEKSLNELKRILKPNGSLIIGDWGKPQNFLMGILFKILQFIDNLKSPKVDFNINLTEIAQRAGFRISPNCSFRNTLFGTFEFLKFKKI